jgi:hypothetical protein
LGGELTYFCTGRVTPFLRVGSECFFSGDGDEFLTTFSFGGIRREPFVTELFLGALFTSFFCVDKTLASERGDLFTAVGRGGGDLPLR